MKAFAQLFAFLAVCIGFASTAYSQGQFLQKGENGLSLGVVYNSNKDASGIGLGGGFSFGGTVDLGLSYESVSLTQKLAGYSVSADAISPSLTIHAIKQTPSGSPVSLALSGSYTVDSYSSSALDQTGVSMDGDVFSFGASVYGNMSISPTAYLQPNATIGYYTGSTKMSDNYGNSLTSNDNGAAFGLSAALVFKVSPMNVIAVAPGVSFDKNYTTFAFSAGFVFGLKK